MSWSRLTLADRLVIEKMLYEENNFQQIADKLKVARSTVDREVERNLTSNGKYCAECAQIKYEERISKERKKSKTDNLEIKKFLENNLKLFSPDVISGRLKLENNGFQISTQSIYTVVYNDSNENGFMHLLLPSKRKKPKKRKISENQTRGCLKNQKSIKERPKSVESRTRHGHFEGDTIVGKNHKSMCFTAIDRKNKSVFIHKLKTRDSNGVLDAVKLMKDYYGEKFKTLTLDNGKEFACHEKITEELNVDVFFAEPGKPYQRGSNENLNKIIRRYLPKGIDFRNVSWQYVRGVMNKLNNTPRKSLNYRTPFEALGFDKFSAMLI